MDLKLDMRLIGMAEEFQENQRVFNPGEVSDIMVYIATLDTRQTVIQDITNASCSFSEKDIIQYAQSKGAY